MKSSHREIIGMTGIVLITIGVGAVYAPAAPIVFGGFLLIAALKARPTE